MATSYKSTYVACFFGIVNQAVIVNITAILFVPFMLLYGFDYWQLGVFVGVNFSAQLVADIILTKFVDVIPYRVQAGVALALSAVGTLAFAILPTLFPSQVYGAMLVATVICAFSGGMQEVVLTPIINATEEGEAKSRAVGLLHSFYAWGQVIMVIVTSLFLKFAGYGNWQYLMGAWSILPLIGSVMFIKCPINEERDKKQEAQRPEVKKELRSPLAIVLMLAILLGGATEIIANQYISTFAVIALGIEKSVADLVGMSLFAVMMGVGRVVFGQFGGRMDISKVLCVCSSLTIVLFLIMGLCPWGIVSFVCCILCGFTVSFLWPGTLVVAGKKFPLVGAKMFAVLAICGDVGAAVLPTAIGFVGDVSLPLAFVVASVLPALCAVCHLIVIKSTKKPCLEIKQGE